MTARLDERSVRRIALTALAGTSIEWYDFFLYGTAAALIFPKAFFPADLPPVIALLRVLQHVRGRFHRAADRRHHLRALRRSLGRKKRWSWRCVLMGAATTLIGCLPTYASIGPSSPRSC